VPIRPENRARYPKDWKAISLEVREAAYWMCEGSPAYPNCRAIDGEPHPVTGSKVVLTVAHLDHTPENCDRANLKAWCQRCHNTYDMPMRRAGIAHRARQASGAIDLFDTDTTGAQPRA
jgi:5-methylcytosine-specific restriction endonuclease McrA